MSETPSRVLVVDDEFAQRRLLSTYLSRENFEILEAGSYIEAIDLLERKGADVAIVDVMMPGADGFELVKAIRSRSDIPIIMLTARGEEAAKVTGLELGADDYVVKPYSAPEVVSRVRAQLRRAQGFRVQATEVTFSGIRLDRAARRCYVNGEEVDLSRREFDLLWIMATNPSKVFSRESLLLAGWGTTYMVEKTVDVHVGSLRRKIGEGLKIKSLRGIGYRLDP